jgi:Rps23 Pro-64 3,4-dihydroxylase Tpa1-like proline 4-hydroxylase
MDLSARICDRLDAEEAALAMQWKDAASINHFILDDVLPADWANDIRSRFPDGKKLFLKRSLRETKYVSAQMDKYDNILEECIYAFQTPDVVRRIQGITGLQALEPDEMLYAGGISLMTHGHFLNPHVDNSHDKFRRRYRVLNLLYYLSPDWTEENGCNLELWPNGPRGKPITITSKFNRLVGMVTHRESWHSVSRNISHSDRCCVSNYYFSKFPIGTKEYFHVTSFRGRPEQPVRDLVLRGDIWLRTAIRKIFQMGITNNPHYYKK